MTFKSFLVALGIGISGLTLSGCVSDDYYGGGSYDPYYSRGGYVGTGIVYDSNRYRNYPRYSRDSRYRDHRYRDRRPDRPNYNRPDRPRPPQAQGNSGRARAYLRPRGNEPR